MKTRLTFLLFLFLVVSCRNDEKICHLTGHLENAPDSTTLYLVDWQKDTLLNTIQVIKGEFDFKFPISHPKYVLLQNERNQYQFRDRKFIWLEPAKINLNGDFEFLNNIKVEGSSSQTEFENYHLLVDNDTKKLNELRNQVLIKTDEKTNTETNEIELIQKNLSDSIMEFLVHHQDSYVTLNSLYEETYFYNAILNKNQIRTVYDNLSDNLKESELGVQIKNYTELPEPPNIGDIANEITQVTPNGETIKLSDYRGKYVLLDFWSSGCGPCRSANKWLRKEYSKYNQKGFEIFGVSGDIDHKSWTYAIEQDSIPWTNVCDLKGWTSETFLMYGVKGIPFGFLINPDGIVIKKGILNQSDLEVLLKRIFEI